AANVAKNRQYIAGTYPDSALSRALQKWVDDHPGASQAQIEAGLLSVFNGFPQDVVLRFSKHMSGDAFDVKPVDGPTGNAIHSDLSQRPGKFLDEEAGLRRWHYQR